MCNYYIQKEEETNQFGSYILQRQKTMELMLQALGLVTVDTAMYKAYNAIKKRAISISTKVKPPDFEKLKPHLGWLPLDIIKCTFECITQLAMQSLIKVPFKQHLKLRTPQLNVPRLVETYATDTLFYQQKAMYESHVHSFCGN